MDMATLADFFHRRGEANKYDFGHVLIVGGSPGMVGAPFLAARAALRVGAGLATIASLPTVVDKLERRVEEVMTLRVPDRAAEAVAVIASFVRERQVKAVVVGSGHAHTMADMDRTLVERLEVPVVIDGGAIGAFSGHLAELNKDAVQNERLILTPHGGEYAKLTGTSLPDDAAGRRRLAVDFAKGYHVTLVLKGHKTLVAHPDGKVYENTTGNPGMATAGMGDVLAGVLAGLLAQGLSTRLATEMGVCVHGVAGDLAARAKTEPGMIASDVIEFLPDALRWLRGKSMIK